MHFVGRTQELARLQRLYDSDRFECIILYGRRRIGKTALINAFVRDKRCVYVTGVDSTASESLAMLSQSIYLCDHDTGTGPVYPTLESALLAIQEHALSEKLVVVLDEYPYLAKSCPAFSSILQKVIDTTYQHNSNLKLILCGSSMSFMEHQVLGYQSPLYGRRTAQLKLKPFDYYGIRPFYTRFDAESLALVYGVTGGIPKYLQCFDDTKSALYNIRDLFLDASGYLYEEPNNLLKQELRDPAVYFALIRAIAEGHNRAAELASAVSMETSGLTAYLNRLMELGIISRQKSMYAPDSRKSLYSLSDSMFRFWFLTVPKQNALIQQGFSDRALTNCLPTIETYMGSVFEQMCVDYLWHHYDTLPVAFTEIGRWWGQNPIQKKTEEIDIVAGTADAAIFCECKWRSQPATDETLLTLIARSHLVDVPRRHFMLFSRAGFTDACRREAEHIGARLVVFWNEQ